MVMMKIVMFIKKRICFFAETVLCFLLIVAMICGFCLLYLKTHINDESVQVTNYETTSGKINKPIRIVQISDLHDFQNVNEVVEKTAEADPDIIVTTGDMFDGNRPDILNTVSLYQGLLTVGCPVYYTTGNHEASKPELLLILKENLEKIGVNVLLNDKDTIYIHNEKVNIIAFDYETKYSASKMNDIHIDNNNFNIVLCHFPENFDKLLASEELYYGEQLPFEMNLILSGHAHGGQIRLHNQGLFAPNQGYLPKWTSGIHQLTDSEYLVINRGLGNSTFPFRINNPSEIVIVDVIPST